MNVNQEGFDRRLAVVQQILQQYELTSTQVTPIAYVEHCPFPFNNFIYKVDLATAAVPATFRTRQPSTSLPPAEGVSTIVIRISNALAEGLNNTNRVQNDVAAQYLARQSIEAAGIRPVVPAVYAWAPCRFPEVSDETGYGWTMSEFKPGADLDGQFSELSLDDMKDVIEQIADIFAAVQRAELPGKVTKFGALTMDECGAIVTGQMPLLKGGPWETYADLWIAKLQAQLEEADKSPLLAGWSAGGVRERIDKFVALGGVDKHLDGADINQRALVHGDFTMNNMLFDSATKRITALLDFDWAAVTHPCDEFLTGLWDIGGGFDERNEKLQPMILAGDFSLQPEGLSEEDHRNWEVAKAWNTAVTRRGVVRPSSIAGMGKIRALRELEELLCPFALGSEVMLKRMSDEEKCKQRAATETKILRWLESYACIE